MSKEIKQINAVKKKAIGRAEDVEKAVIKEARAKARATIDAARESAQEERAKVLRQEKSAALNKQGDHLKVIAEIVGKPNVARTPAEKHSLFKYSAGNVIKHIAIGTLVAAAAVAGYKANDVVEENYDAGDVTGIFSSVANDNAAVASVAPEELRIQFAAMDNAGDAVIQAARLSTTIHPVTVCETKGDARPYKVVSAGTYENEVAATRIALKFDEPKERVDRREPVARSVRCDADLGF